MTAPANTDLYYQTYKVYHHPEGITDEAISKMDDVGACHDLLIVSVMHQEDGGVSYAIIGRTADGAEPSPTDEFKIWAIMAHRLMGSLPEGFRRELCKTAFQIIQELTIVGGWFMTEYKVRPPEAYEDACEPNDDGWPVWKTRDEGSCPACLEVENLECDEADTRLFALECPVCSEAGCDLCFPMGRGVACPTCE